MSDFPADPIPKEVYAWLAALPSPGLVPERTQIEVAQEDVFLDPVTWNRAAFYIASHSIVQATVWEPAFFWFEGRRFRARVGTKVG
jgi:hypothetical protein